jgi:hypothetical protein
LRIYFNILNISISHIHICLNYSYRANPSLIDKSDVTRAIDKAKKTCVFVSIVLVFYNQYQKFYHKTWL